MFSPRRGRLGRVWGLVARVQAYRRSGASVLNYACYSYRAPGSKPAVGVPAQATPAPYGDHDGQMRGALEVDGGLEHSL